MDFSLTESEQALVDLCREFAQKEIATRAPLAWEEARCPTDLLREMGSLGLLGILIPEEWGGIGMSTVEMCIRDRYRAASPTGGHLFLRPPVRPRLGGSSGGRARHQPAWRGRAARLQPSGVRGDSHDHDRERVLLISCLLYTSRCV